jgi:hypothetical protein
MIPMDILSPMIHDLHGPVNGREPTLSVCNGCDALSGHRAPGAQVTTQAQLTTPRPRHPVPVKPYHFGTYRHPPVPVRYRPLPVSRVTSQSVLSKVCSMLGWRGKRRHWIWGTWALSDDGQKKHVCPGRRVTSMAHADHSRLVSSRRA